MSTDPSNNPGPAAESDGEPIVDKRVDEDWKARFRKEKEKLRQEAAAQQQGADKGADEAASGESDKIFLQFVSTLVAEVQMYLGLVPHPMTGQQEFQPDQARYLIEVLRSLNKKTQGAQSAEEQRFFQQVLSEIQMAYVQVAQQHGGPAGAPGPAGDPSQG